MNAGPLHSVSVAGVTFDAEGRVLLIRRRDTGDWQAPGGVLEHDEGLEAGVAREVLEETGVHVRVGVLSGVYKNMRAKVIALVYRCEFAGGAALPTDESTEVAWLSVPEAQQLMRPAFYVRVLDAVNPKDGASSRSHDGIHLL